MNLVKYDAACRAIAEAKAVDEVKLIRDKAAAIAAAARVAKNHGLEIDAAEIRIRAERRLGEMIAEQKRTARDIDRGGILQRRPQCEVCGFDITEILEVHHRVAVSCGGGNDDENLVVLCPNCHRLAHKAGALANVSEELGAFAAKHEAHIERIQTCLQQAQ